MSESVLVKVEGDEIVVKTPYDVYFVEKLKKAFVNSERNYDKSQKLWKINYTQDNFELVQRMVQEHFFNTEEKLVIFKCMGEAPRVNRMPLVDYWRDNDCAKRAWCFDVIVYRRVGYHGSRNYPEFNGLVLAKVLMNKETKISSKSEMEYKVYPYTKSLHMTAVELVEKAESLDDYEKIVEKLDRMVQKLEGFSVEVAKEAVAVQGLLVVSSLPSKALLDKILPKEYKQKRIGSEVIQIVRGYFYNKIGVLSRKFYNDILQKHGVWAGFGYIIPYHRVYQFLRAVEELRGEYKKFEEELRAFLERGEIPEDKREKVEQGRVNIDPEYLEIVREYLAEHGVEKIEVPDITNRVKIRLIPFNIDIKMVEEYLEDKAVQSVKRELEAVKHEMFESVKEQLDEKISSIFERLKAYEKKRMSRKVIKKLKEDINYILKTAEELGVEVERAEFLKKTVETIEESEEVEASMEEVDGRLKALLKEIQS